MKNRWAMGKLMVLGGNCLLWVIGLAVLVAPLVLALARSDDRYRISLGVGSAWLATLRNDTTWIALGRSGAIGVSATLVGLSIVGSLLAISRRHKWLPFLVLALYALDPTTRAVAYQLFFDRLSAAIEWDALRHIAKLYFAPAIALGAQYAPLFWFFRLLEPPPSMSLGRLGPTAELLFQRIPGNFFRLPVQGSIFFLLALFDLWLVELVSGSTKNLWGPLLVQRLLSARNLSAGATMTVSGLVAVVGFFLLLKAVCFGASKLWRQVSPLWLASKRIAILDRSVSVIEGLVAYGGILVVAWPLSYALWRAELSETSVLAEVGWLGVLWASAVTVVLSMGGAYLASRIGLSLSAAKQAKWVAPGLIEPPAVAAALAPEAAFLLLAVLIAGTGLLKPGLFLSGGLILSFAVPIGYLCWEALLVPVDRRRLDLPIRAMGTRLLFGVATAAREFRSIDASIVLIVFWLIGEDVILLDFSSGPLWKPFAPLQYGNAQRGLISHEYLGALAAAGIRLLPMALLASIAGPRVASGDDKT